MHETLEALRPFLPQQRADSRVGPNCPEFLAGTCIFFVFLCVSCFSRPNPIQEVLSTRHSVLLGGGADKQLAPHYGSSGLVS